MSQLIDAVRSAKTDVRVERTGISIGEIISLYQQGEIILQPVYQRGLVWTKEHKDLLIESILLGLPIPSIFFAVDADGNLEVVDGLQRLSTILSFTVGHQFVIDTPLKYLPQLNGLSYTDWDNPTKLEFKRARLDAVCLDSLTTHSKKMELFNRINQTNVYADCDKSTKK